MSSIRFLMLGGFLGAGKTTTISRLARHYQSQGHKVGIVTNDQATDLVDTNSLRAQGFDVGEVPGACFCCNFNKLTETVGELNESARPDIVLAEPVGSCTDLVATVVRPLQQLFSATFDVAPYAVLLKPSHGGRILRGDARGGFSPQASYIFKKQLEEADLIVINRIDELPADEAEALASLLATQYPAAPVLRMSARTGAGFDALVELLAQRGQFGRRVMDVDYDTYAIGEAELGWLNMSLSASARQPMALDELLLDIISRLQDSLAAIDAETAHLKAIGMADGAYGVANLVSSFSQPELSLPSRALVTQAQLVVNARVATAPETLTDHVERAVQAACAARGAAPTFQQTQSFRPGRPVPTHRILEPIA
ncbi:MAG: cobalamin biosynthesis protein P47K [Planctomycetaceae bacterium]|nr:cobalamin biosynthesis protein P47K [Planctomycetaceae bacterium]